MSVTINGTSGVTFNDASSQNTAATGFGFKNRIINGAMVIDQRNAGAALTVNDSNNFFAVDRFAGNGQSADGVFTLQRSTTAPSGFLNSIIATVTTADSSIGASQRYVIRHNIEGLNVTDLNWGTANAATVTLSFWVRSSLTGTFGGSLSNSAFNRSYPFSYTISSANTWEQKSITITGDTTGTWLTDNGVGIRLDIGLGAGSSVVGTAGAWAASGYHSATGATNLIATNGATFYITGVQLEKGSTATSFDYRPYGTELALCQRYLPAFNLVGGDVVALVTYATSTSGYVAIPFSVPTRTQATGASITNPTNFTAFSNSNITPSAIAYGGASVNSGQINLTVSGATIGQSALLRATGTAQILFTGCEL